MTFLMMAFSFQISLCVVLFITVPYRVYCFVGEHIETEETPQFREFALLSSKSPNDDFGTSCGVNLHGLHKALFSIQKKRLKNGACYAYRKVPTWKPVVNTAVISRLNLKTSILSIHLSEKQPFRDGWDRWMDKFEFSYKIPGEINASMPQKPLTCLPREFVMWLSCSRSNSSACFFKVMLTVRAASGL